MSNVQLHTSVVRRARISRMALQAVFALCFMGVLVVAAWGWTLRQVNRDMPPMPQQEALTSFQRSVAWLQNNEPVVLQDGNAALWWMVDAAAKRSGDPYLAQLVERYLAQVFQGVQAQSPWLRLVRPQAQVARDLPLPEQLVDYQKHLLSAATCQAAPSLGDHDHAFLETNLCRPMLTKVWLGDRVCSTHQVVALLIQQRNRCASPTGLARLQSELLDDIQTQTSLDPFMRDATLQRVLVLAWAGNGQRIAPSWVLRVRDAQHADGGWAGEASLPEWPAFLQPRLLKSLAARALGRPPRTTIPSDFHATAQGMLLMALLAYPVDAVKADSH